MQYHRIRFNAYENRQYTQETEDSIVEFSAWVAAGLVFACVVGGLGILVHNYTWIARIFGILAVVWLLGCICLAGYMACAIVGARGESRDG